MSVMGYEAAADIELFGKSSSDKVNRSLQVFKQVQFDWASVLLWGPHI